MINRAMGSTTTAEMIPWMTPATIFSAAITCVDTGASNRSSISFVHPKSWTMGSATD